MSDITIDDQINCLRRELALRRSAYPKWVKLGKMTEREADRQIEVMQSVLDLLVGIKGVRG